MLLPSSIITSLVFRVSDEISNENQKFVYARNKIVFNFIIHSWKMRFAYRWRSRFNPPASRKIKLWIQFRNKESLFEYYEMIRSVGTWSNPMKLLGRYDTAQSAPQIPHLNLLDCKVQNRFVVLSTTKTLEYVNVYTENI